MIAVSLAKDFCDWKDGDARRQKVVQLFRDDYWEGDKGDDYEGDDERGFSLSIF